MKTPKLFLKHPPLSGIVLALGAALTLWCGRTQAGDAFPDPNTPWPIPGLIQLENFDYGGEGVAFHTTEPTNHANYHNRDFETDPVTGSNYQVNVSIQTTGDPDEYGGLDVWWNAPGVWYRYTVDATPGNYDVWFRSANPAGSGVVTLKANGTGTNGDVLCKATIDNTGGWSPIVYRTSKKLGVTIPHGVTNILYYQGDDAAPMNNLANWFQFVPAPTAPPEVPSGLIATALTPYGIQLDWNPATNASLIHIERKDGVSGTYAEVGTAGGTDTTYTDGAGLFSGHTYYYRLRAENTYGGVITFSAYSNEANATPAATAASQPFSQAYEVSGTTDPTQETEAGTARSVLRLMQAAWFDIGGE